MPHTFNPTVLREYDIRGIIGETLGPDDARAIGRGFATLLRRAGGKLVAVGYADRERLRRAADRHERHADALLRGSFSR
jgi:phosphomannomutase